MAPVARPASQARDDRRRALAARVLESVEARLAAGEPFSQLSVEQLITATGVSRSTFYVYFEDKGALLLALAGDVVEQLIAAAQVWWDLPPATTEGEVERALRGLADVYGRHALVWSALVDASASDERVRAQFRDVVERAAAGLARHIRDRQRTGDVHPDLDARRTALWLTWMTERGLHQLTPGASRAELDRLCRAQTRIVWQTLYAGAPNRRG